MAVKVLRCRECGAEVPAGPVYVCERCFGPLEAVYDLDALRRLPLRERIAAGPRSIWRYVDLLPVDYDPAVDLSPGMTPLVAAPRLGEALGLRRLYLKNDSTNPTWSFKDRAVEIGTAAARRFGYRVLACASTGNLANSVAAHAARAGMRAVVFVPAGIEQGKIVQSAIYGPTVIEVEGGYDEVNRLCTEIGEEHHWAFLNVNMRPYYSEGGKTLAYEVAEQLGWRAPDDVVVPVASGNLMVKIHKGFGELAELGLIERTATRVHGAQAAGCAPVAEAFSNGGEVRPVRPNTIAHSLAIGTPADGRYAIAAARASGGRVAAVSDDEIVDAIGLLARTEGIFTETAGGVTVATLRALAAAGALDPDGVTVAYITGMGLKTANALAGMVAKPVRIRPSLRAFEAAVLTTTA
ncbi:MAG: threonine synthase [Armatimonadota bacterium]|nr:threonine synthase [Armatimonadota bacterium]MDR7423294.1 threonine synthase [Armatimonadota bacterium]MDR7455004.1 threonine synthase [Armatimonadota bacterium]MDR7496854.1 threonine synthase [Armatimonadota bacterium]MDR7512270.1 threonine synthase [Armatimonadota bacterium]